MLINSERVRVSLPCDNSGEASIPKSDLSPTSDIAGVAARSSPELQVDSMLPSLEGRIIGVASVLVTSTGAFGFTTCERYCSTNQPSKNPVCPVEMVGLCEGNNKANEVRVFCE